MEFQIQDKTDCVDYRMLLLLKYVILIMNSPVKNIIYNYFTNILKHWL